MPDARSLLIYLALAAVVAGLGVRQVLAGGEGAGAGAGADAAPAPARTAPRVEDPRAGGGARLTVHVAGRVRRPGVYRLREGARVDDAVRRAGGARGDADLTAVNLAAEVEDGRQVIVPARADPGAGGGPSPAGAPVMPGQPLNLNLATAEQLQELDGIGPGLAGKIVAHREEHGGFGSVDELGEVPGIGEKRLAALREQVTV